LLTSRKFEELLETFRSRYDFVVMDTPPLLVVSDPGMVAARADATLLTIRIGKSGRSAAERASELLRELQSALMGVIVNGMDGQHLLNRYGYQDRHYGYGSDYHDGPKNRLVQRPDSPYSNAKTKREKAARGNSRIPAQASVYRAFKRVSTWW